MPRFEDYKSDSEVHDIMEKFVEKFPTVFDGFDVDGMHFIMTQKKKTQGPALKVRPVGYPMEVFVGKPYIVEIFEESWKGMSPKRKNLAVFHIMCAIPEGGLDPLSKYYAKKVKPDIVMYRLEYAASGGVPNWMENDLASDPMDVEPEDVASVLTSQTIEDDDPIPDEPTGPGNQSKHPVTAEHVASVGADEEAA